MKPKPNYKGRPNNFFKAYMDELVAQSAYFNAKKEGQNPATLKMLRDIWERAVDKLILEEQKAEKKADAKYRKESQILKSNNNGI